jgi:2-dehydropantoate 2-reductase
MRIAVFGAGGVGGYFGGRLAQKGQDVTFIARGAHLDALRSRGLHVYSINGDFTIKPVNATDNPAQVGIADVILVATKAWQVTEAAHAIQPMVGPQTIVVPLLNGVEAPDQLARVINRSQVLGGLCWIVSFVEQPGVIRHTGVEPKVVFSTLDRMQNERAQQLFNAFLQANVKVDMPQDIQMAMWEKFIFITPMSSIGAVTRVPVGITRSVPQTRQMIETAIDEIIAVAWATGVRLQDTVFSRTMTFIDNMPAHSTLSMQRDIMDERPSELEAQTGAVVRLGMRYDVATPLHAFLYNSLLPMEMLARGQIDHFHSR